MLRRYTPALPVNHGVSMITNTPFHIAPQLLVRKSLSFPERAPFWGVYVGVCTLICFKPPTGVRSDALAWVGRGWGSLLPERPAAVAGTPGTGVLVAGPQSCHRRWAAWPHYEIAYRQVVLRRKGVYPRETRPQTLRQRRLRRRAREH